MRILYIDNDDSRRARVNLAMASVIGPQIIAMSEAQRARVESETFDWIFVHLRNEPEATGLFTGEWDRKGANLVVFSGQWSKDEYTRVSDRLFRVPAQLMIEDFPSLWGRMSIA